MSRRRIGDQLVDLGVITPAQLQDALESQRMAPDPLGAVLVRLGDVTEERLLEVLALQYGVQAWPLHLKPPEPSAVLRLPESLAREYQVLPVKVEGLTLYLAVSNPEDLEALDMVRYATRLQVEPVLAHRHRLLRAIEQAYGGKETNVDDLVTMAVSRVDEQKPVQVEEAAEAEAPDAAPVVGLVNQILTDAIRQGASDIHIEPREEYVQIRYRIDGVLKEVNRLPRNVIGALTSRAFATVPHADGSEHCRRSSCSDNWNHGRLHRNRQRQLRNEYQRWK